MPTISRADHLYVYAAIEGTPATLPSAGMPEGKPPRAVHLQGATSIVVSNVPSTLYNAARIEARLSDLDWVSTAGAAHHAVVDALLEAAVVVLPFRLFTIFSSEETAIATITAMLPSIERAFDRVRGREEWVLRIGKPDASRVPRPEQSGAVRTGTDFLANKAAARRAEIERSERVKRDAAAAYESLVSLAESARAKPVDPAGTLVLDAAFLLMPSRINVLKETLTTAARQLLADGCAVSLTGPWPPYSFASLETSTDD